MPSSIMNASTVDFQPPGKPKEGPKPLQDPESLSPEHGKRDSEEEMTSELISAGSEQLQRKLGGKEIQLLAVGGAIGTCK